MSRRKPLTAEERASAFEFLADALQSHQLEFEAVSEAFSDYTPEDIAERKRRDRLAKRLLLELMKPAAPVVVDIDTTPDSIIVRARRGRRTLYRAADDVCGGMLTGSELSDLLDAVGVPNDYTFREPAR